MHRIVIFISQYDSYPDTSMPMYDLHEVVSTFLFGLKAIRNTMLDETLMRLYVFLSEILGSKKKAYAELARQINYTKSEMDNCRQKLDQMRLEREAQSKCCVRWVRIWKKSIDINNHETNTVIILNPYSHYIVLTLVVPNLFNKTWIFICIFYHFSTLKWHWSLFH